MKLNECIKGFIVILLLSSLGFLSIPVQAQQTKNRSSKIFAKKAKPNDHTIEVKTIENRIIVSNAPVNATIEIYNIIGTKVEEIEMKQSSGEYTVSLPKGYYIVRIADTVRKIVIR